MLNHGIRPHLQELTLVATGHDGVTLWIRSLSNGMQRAQSRVRLRAIDVQ